LDLCVARGTPPSADDFKLRHLRLGAAFGEELVHLPDQLFRTVDRLLADAYLLDEAISATANRSQVIVLCVGFVGHREPLFDHFSDYGA
jgi:hypothetical protein